MKCDNGNPGMNELYIKSLVGASGCQILGINLCIISGLQTSKEGLLPFLKIFAPEFEIAN